MAEMFGKASGCSGGRGGSMHFFDASRRFYGGYAIVGGGLPVAVGLALADAMQGNARRHRLLLRRRRRRRGRVPRVDEPRRALEAAGALPLREQPLRDGDADRALAGPARHGAAGARLRRPGRRSPTGWTCSRSRRPSARRPRPCAAAAGPHLVELKTYRFRAHSLVRPRPLPLEGGGRGVADDPRPDRPLRRPAGDRRRRPSSASRRRWPPSSRRRSRSPRRATGSRSPRLWNGT